MNVSKSGWPKQTTVINLSRRKKYRFINPKWFQQILYKRNQKLTLEKLIRILAKHYATPTHASDPIICLRSIHDLTDFQGIIGNCTCEEILSRLSLTLHISDQDICDDKCRKLWDKFAKYLENEFWIGIDESQRNNN